ncbi:MAG: hypothetical protein JGK25_32170 [Microcoleus sp. PH2017_18_LLB_O_A]|nr:hypothetical protein [Microcoleus sp. PH2017_18_LLB_O_A]
MGYHDYPILTGILFVRESLSSQNIAVAGNEKTSPYKFAVDKNFEGGILDVLLNSFEVGLWHGALLLNLSLLIAYSDSGV